jgi:hypothetical protein
VGAPISRAGRACSGRREERRRAVKSRVFIGELIFTDGPSGRYCSASEHPIGVCPMAENRGRCRPAVAFSVENRGASSACTRDAAPSAASDKHRCLAPKCCNSWGRAGLLLFGSHTKPMKKTALLLTSILCSLATSSSADLPVAAESHASAASQLKVRTTAYTCHGAKRRRPLQRHQAQSSAMVESSSAQRQIGPGCRSAPSSG